MQHSKDKALGDALFFYRKELLNNLNIKHIYLCTYDCINISIVFINFEYQNILTSLFIAFIIVYKKEVILCLKE